VALWKTNFADYKLDSSALTILLATNGGNLGGNSTRTDSAKLLIALGFTSCKYLHGTVSTCAISIINHTLPSAIG